jgi:hypothetical protein
MTINKILVPILLMAIALFIGMPKAQAAATMYCVKDTTKCAFGTPSTSYLSLADRTRALYSMTVTQYNAAATNKTFEPKTSNELIVLAKALIASQVCNPATHTGIWPNCVLIPPPPPPKPTCTVDQVYNAATNQCDAIPCGDSFLPGFKPNCTPKPPPAPTGQSGLMPSVDVSKNIVPAIGYSKLLIKPTTEQPKSTVDSAFRISCLPSHMSNDDPMVYPNQQGATHHHTFYGNTSVDYKSNLMELATTGNSTCDGGTMNRSAYWHPTVINTLTNAPVLPDQGAIFYYKIGHTAFAGKLRAPPKGLRMLAGNPKATSAADSQASKYVCINIALQHSNGMAWQKALPNCGADSFMQQVVTFPQCWDGKNLDSPNHKDHMAYPNNGVCPTDFVPIPEISMNLNYKYHANAPMNKWRLASDNYATTSPGGYSGHADWVNGWDQPTLEGIVKNCLNSAKDCHAHLLGDGRMFYREP